MITFSSTHLIYLIEAARWTLLLSVLAFIGGGILGLVLALGRVSEHKPLRWLSAAYIQIIQGTPLLVVLFLSYFGLSILGLDIPPIAAAGLSLTLYTSAFLGEIWRGCILSVPKTQWEASNCIGLSRAQQYRYVILPQAARIAIPPTVGFMVQIIKNTSITSIIGFVELARAGQIVNNSTFQPFITFVFVAIIYFAMCYPLSLASRHFERKLNVGK
ncbi:amino acid ABC transporter permease [Kaistia granuli]|jgi:polar amino acid transport system permease protein|uniref:amino acid ABC transporter permease n=1 Tax=Kaistia granuli TaxID=363259 RepID=UPI00036B6A8A|nr:amino acid ABC transporter permease [Kaistia granuli]